MTPTRHKLSTATFAEQAAPRLDARCLMALADVDRRRPVDRRSVSRGDYDRRTTTRRTTDRRAD